MARVHLSAGLRDLTGGVANIEIEASTVGRLIKSLDQMFPGIGSRLSEGSSVAINGEILTDAEYEENLDDKLFVGANNSPIERFGSCKTVMSSKLGKVGCTWQMASVSRALHSVGIVA
jgi:molybdopterin converting factor small subunit